MLIDWRKASIVRTRSEVLKLLFSIGLGLDWSSDQVRGIAGILFYLDLCHCQTLSQPTGQTTFKQWKERYSMGIMNHEWKDIGVILIQEAAFLRRAEDERDERYPLVPSCPTPPPGSEVSELIQPHDIAWRLLNYVSRNLPSLQCLVRDFVYVVVLKKDLCSCWSPILIQDACISASSKIVPLMTSDTFARIPAPLALGSSLMNQVCYKFEIIVHPLCLVFPGWTSYQSHIKPCDVSSDTSGLRNIRRMQRASLRLDVLSSR